MVKIKAIKELLEEQPTEKASIAPSLSAKESAQYHADKVELARDSLYPRTAEETKAWLVGQGLAEPDELNDDHREWYKDDKAIANAVEAAKTDAVIYSFLKRWVAGDTPLEFPNPVPAPLLGFIHDMMGDRFEKPLGQPKREFPKALLNSIIAEIRLAYGGTKGQAVAAIAEAAGMSLDGVKKILYRGEK